MHFKTLTREKASDPNVGRDMIYELLEFLESQLVIRIGFSKEAIYNETADNVVQITIEQGKRERLMSIGESSESVAVKTKESMVDLLFQLPAINHNLLYFAYMYGVDRIEINIRRDYISFSAHSQKAPIINELGVRRMARVAFSLVPANLVSTIRPNKKTKELGVALAN